jgi:transcriptional regulator with XRE-family HTH domain
MLAVSSDRWTADDAARVAEWIRAAREAKGWSQAELAAGTGVTTTTISRWERGASVPRRGALLALSRAFDRAPDRFSSAPRRPHRPSHVEAAAHRIARALAEITTALRDAR